MAFVQSINANGLSTNAATTSAFNSTIHNTLVVGATTDNHDGSGTDTLSITDSQGLTWHAHPANPFINNSGANSMSAWIAYDNTGSASHTITVHAPAGTDIAFVVHEFSGRDLTAPVGIATSGSDGAGTTSHSTGSGTAAANDDVWAFNHNVGASTETYTAGTGFTKPTNSEETNNANYNACMAQYKANVSSGSVTDVWTTGASSVGYGLMFSLKVAGAASSFPPVPSNVPGVRQYGPILGM